MRNKIVGLLGLVLACVLVPSAQAQPDVTNLVQGNNEFAFALDDRLAAKDGNLFFSPYSISNALAMTYAGARGNTAAEMKKTLRFNLDDERLHAAFNRVIADLDGGDPMKRPFQLSVANRLWGQKDYGFHPAFLKIGQDFYRAGLEELDFGRSEEARKIINAWVEKQTKDKIKNLIPEGEITGLTRLVLTNAIYFKAAWQTPFEPALTKPGSFHLADVKTVEVPMMHANPMAGFANRDTFTLLELPYKDRQQSMVILLPKKKDGLAELEKKLSAANLAAWLKDVGAFEVDVKLPKFKVTAEFKLNRVLIEMGMKDAFVHGRADFSGMATREDLSISAVLHKAFVDVNEAGTEAAAATAVIIRGESKPPRASFHAEHGFLFLIRDHATGTILFVGRVANPK
ncbi:MAG: serpin family protein [Planctomycetes bacterium]|nr:serpin family protein [Planctomycetota bacterium]